MRADTLINKTPLKEFMIILSILAFTCYYYALLPIFAEHINSLHPDNPIAATASEESASVSQKEWHSIKSDYFIIYYRPKANLKAIERRLRRRSGFYIGGVQRQINLSGIDRKIAYRMDILFRRCKEILGMYPRIKNIKVKIFSNREKLNNEYYEIFKETKDLKSFYIYKYNTIYSSEEDISDSVIAHEMGHAIVDHYFVARSPEKVREMLAQYVDLHLED